MVKIKWSDFLNPDKKIAINCRTKEDSSEFLKMLSAKGARWCDGDRITDTETFFDDCKELLCYFFTFQGLSYGSIKYRWGDGYTVYRYSEVEFVDDDPEESAEPELLPKKDALTSITAAMAEIRDNLQSSADLDTITTNSIAMKLLAEAFKIVSDTNE